MLADSYSVSSSSIVFTQELKNGDWVKVSTANHMIIAKAVDAGFGVDVLCVGGYKPLPMAVREGYMVEKINKPKWAK